MARGVRRSKKVKKPKMVQSTLPGVKKTNVKCLDCDFVYEKTRKDSVLKHNAFHSDFLYGKKLSKTTIHKLTEGKNVVDTVRVEVNNQTVKVSVIFISCVDKTIVDLVSDLLEIVNKQWLNAGACPTSWKTRPLECKVVLLLAESFLDKEVSVRLIGITLLDVPEMNTSFLIGHHMNVKDSTIDPGKSELRLRLGVSRIYVHEYYRRKGLSVLMLNSILKHSVYGTVLTPWQLGFSQPSGSGLLLLKNWYGTPTIPVYHEE